MKNPISIFPNGIDSRIFYSDCNIENLPVLENYKQLLSVGKYTDAKNLLENSDIDYFGAWILNLLENRLYALERYLKEDVAKPELVFYSDTEPDATEVGQSWVSDN